MRRQSFLSGRAHILALALLLIPGASPARSQSTVINLSGPALSGSAWRMASFPFDAGVPAQAFAVAFNDSSFTPVNVPSDTQLQAGFTGSARFEQTAQLLAVNQHEWWYRKHFPTPAHPSGFRTRILFEGVDYFTTVWLNGTQIGTHEGTYTTFSFDITDLLRPDGDNVLALLVTHPYLPPGRALSELTNGDFSLAAPWVNLPIKALPYFTEMHWDALPAGGNNTFAMGIWRPVTLITEPFASLRNLHAETLSLSTAGNATLRFEATIHNASSHPTAVRIPLTLAPANFPGNARSLPILSGIAPPGDSTLHQTFNLPAAHLWWSWDQGPQDMYLLSANLNASPGIRDSQSIRFGVRTVTRDPVNMTFRLNGRRIFLKGSFFPVEDYFRSTPTAEDYERDLRLFRDANFNQVTSLTTVEQPPFYSLCDELGLLLVVQLPFPQFGPMQVLDHDNPRREPFLAHARETTSNVLLQLRSHPSIVEWAPLAEAHDKSENGKWGANGAVWDQQGYDTFIAQMHSIVTRLAPSAIFHPSLCDLGEQHFWMAAAGLPGSDASYQEHFDASAGFISEYGSISMSNSEHLDRYLTPEQQWNPGGLTPSSWLHLPLDLARYAYWTSLEYEGLWSMLWRSHHSIDAHPTSAVDLVRDTQAYHAFLMQYAAEAYRRKKYEPVMGMRSWCFLEVAPGFRFGLLDYDRVPKEAYYAVRRAQAPIALSFTFRDALAGQLAGRPWSTHVHIINDTRNALQGQLAIALLDLSGNTLAQQTFPATVAADGKLDAATFSIKLPQHPGAYLLQASYFDPSGTPLADTRIPIKVAAPLTPTPIRVLLIGQSTYAAPIRSMLQSLGADITPIDENSIQHADHQLLSAAAVHSSFDVIWLSRMDGVARLLPAATATALRDAVALGTGLVHTGGKGSFHGGWIHAALLEATALSDALPVTLRDRNDIIPAPHSDFDDLSTKTVFGSIATDDPALKFTSTLLAETGIASYNKVSPRPSASTLISISGDPLLVTGTFGKGQVAVFTGFTPVNDARSHWSTDERVSAEPSSRALFALLRELLTLALPPQPLAAPIPQVASALLNARIDPLYELLSSQPQTTVAVTPQQDLQPEFQANATSGLTVHTFSVRCTGGFAHTVHLRLIWPPGDTPFYTSLSDNDFDLLPGEIRTLRLRTKSSSAANPAAPILEVTGPNLRPTTTALHAF